MGKLGAGGRCNRLNLIVFIYTYAIMSSRISFKVVCAATIRYDFQRRFAFIGVVSNYINFKGSLMITCAKQFLMLILAAIIMSSLFVGCGRSGNSVSPRGTGDTAGTGDSAGTEVPVNSGTGSLSGSGK